MPQITLPLRFAENISHESAIVVFVRSADAGPGGTVLHVEGDVVRLSQWVHVDVVELEQVFRFELSQSSHLSLFLSLPHFSRVCLFLWLS